MNKKSKISRFCKCLLFILPLLIICVFAGCSHTAMFDLRDENETFVFTDRAEADETTGLQSSTLPETTAQPATETTREETTAPAAEETTAETTEAQPEETAVPERSLTEYEFTSEESISSAADEAYAGADATAGYYVLNTNTKKFHLPTCASVKQIKDKNRKDVTSSRDVIIGEGYEPCKRCNP